MAGADGSIPPLPLDAAKGDSLFVVVGPPTPRAIRAVFRGADEAWMLARGQETATEVILLAGGAFVRSTRAIYAALSARQQASLLGYHPSFDAVIVHELGLLQDANDRYDRIALTGGLSVGERRQRAREAHTGAVGLRMAVWQTLRDALGGEHPVMVGLAAAMKAAETTDIATEGLVTLADALERLRAEDADLRDDLDLVKLDDACITAMRDTAAKARDAARLAEAKPQDLAAAQRALDLQDGRVLHAIGVVSRAFRRARRGDGTMLTPELGPLARVFGVGARDAGDDEPDAPTPAPAPAPTPAPNG